VSFFPEIHENPCYLSFTGAETIHDTVRQVVKKIIKMGASSSRSDGNGPRRAPHLHVPSEEYAALIPKDDGIMPCEEADTLFDCAQHAMAQEFRVRMRRMAGQSRGAENVGPGDASGSDSDSVESTSNASTFMGARESARLLFWACGGGSGTKVMPRTTLTKRRRNESDKAEESTSGSSDNSNSSSGGDTDSGSDLEDDSGRTEDERRASIVRDLIKLGGADPNSLCPEEAVNPRGLYPVHLAVTNGFVETLRELIDGGADPHLQPVPTMSNGFLRGEPDGGGAAIFSNGSSKQQKGRGKKDEAVLQRRDTYHYTDTPATVPAEPLRRVTMFLARVSLRSLAASAGHAAVVDWINSVEDIFGAPSTDELAFELVALGMWMQDEGAIAEIMENRGGQRLDLTRHPLVEHGFRTATNSPYQKTHWVPGGDWTDWAGRHFPAAASTRRQRKILLRQVRPDRDSTSTSSPSGSESESSGIGSGDVASDIGDGEGRPQPADWLELLISEGLDVDCADANGETAVMYRTRGLCNTYMHEVDAVLVALHLVGADFLRRNNAGQTAYEIAKLSNVTRFTMLLDQLQRMEKMSTVRGTKTKSAGKR
jgi:Ankyrin repeat